MKTYSERYYDYAHALKAIGSTRRELVDREKEVIKLQGLMLERGDTLRDAADALKNIGVILPAPECAVCDVVDCDKLSTLFCCVCVHKTEATCLHDVIADACPPCQKRIRERPQ